LKLDCILLSQVEFEEVAMVCSWIPAVAAVCFSVSAAKRKDHRLFAKEILQLRQFSDKFVSG
jgi:hypothetical protein